MNEKMSLLYKIEQIRANGQNPVYKNIATNILINLNRIEDLKVSSIAKISNVSTSSVTRFSQMLGSSGYKELAFTLVWERDLQNKTYHMEEFVDSNKNTFNYSAVEKMIASELWNVSKNDCQLICSMASLIKQNKVIFLFGTGEYGQVLQILRNDLMWQDKTIIFSSDLDNQVYYSKNVSKNDVAFFMDDAMNGNEFIDILKNVSERTEKICILSFNNRALNQNTYWLNLAPIIGENKVIKLPFLVLVSKTIIALLAGGKLNG